MATFSAVVTTGIYCRADCPARPNSENVQHFELAAAAEAAGFRPCLRCRPYRTDQPVSWVGPELLCRAVQLIVDGALDTGNESDLGRRLGVSPRHLRRMFAEHVGVTPDQLARSRRAHFARRLLDDTDLSITEVAIAAGFGSARQLNRVCVELFQAPPRELRARRRSSDRLVADGGLSLRLPFAGPIELDATLDYLAARAIKGVEHVEGRTYRRTITVEGDPGVIELSPGDEDHMLLRIHLPHWEGLIHLVEMSRRIFNLDADPLAALDHLGHDPIVGSLVQARPGLRVPGTWDPFEIGVRAILGQQVSVTRAGKMADAVVSLHGRPVPGLGQLGLTHLFPPAEVLADADLTGVGLTSARAAAVKAFSRAVASGSVVLDRSVGLDGLIESITSVRGLGPWTAQYLALRLGEPDAFPVGDAGLARAVGSLLGEVPGRAELTRLAGAWRPWRATAAVHLWGAGTGHVSSTTRRRSA